MSDTEKTGDPRYLERWHLLWMGGVVAAAFAWMVTSFNGRIASLERDVGDIRVSNARATALLDVVSPRLEKLSDRLDTYVPRRGQP